MAQEPLEKGDSLDDRNFSNQDIAAADLDSLAAFTAGLAEGDRQTLEQVLARVEQHRPALKHSGHDLPYQVYLLSLLLEHHKEVTRLRQQLEDLLAQRSRFP